MAINLLTDSEFLTGPYVIGYEWAIWSFVQGGGPNGSNRMCTYNNGTGFNGYFNKMSIPVTAGQTITASVFYNMTAAVSGAMTMAIQDQNGTWQTNSTYNGMTTGGSGYVTATLVIPVGMTSATHLVSVTTPVYCTNGNYVWISQPMFQYGSSFSTYIPSPMQTYGAWSAAALSSASLATTNHF